jgi:acetolactate synthase-1/3 small subunit
VSATTGTAIRHHTLSVLVENKAGVLARVANLFSRRGYNINSLAVAPTDDEALSRITIVVDVESAPLEQIVKQLDKLVNVVRITELDPRESIERELLLITVRTTPANRSRLTEITATFEGRIVAEAADAVTISLEAHPERIDELEALLTPFGIADVARTGRVALPRLDLDAAPPAV